ncbi:MAG: hypothetical protein NTW59_03020 [Candidatus Diapherotrites archaeon]|nr:hypothetical protein [Candidatus Diapherotrites archaeon]
MKLDVSHPVKAVESAFEHPNPGLAFGLVAAGAIVWVAQAFAIGGVADPMLVAAGVIGAFVTFIVLAAIVFIIGKLAAAKEAKKGFSAVVSGLALMQIPQIVVYILSIPAFFLVFPNGMPSGVNTAGGDAFLVAAQLNNAIVANNTPVNWTLLWALLAVTFVIGVYSFYLLYLTVKRFTSRGALGSFITAVIALAANTLFWALASEALSMI